MNENPLSKLYDVGGDLLSRRFNAALPDRFDDFIAAKLNENEALAFLIDYESDSVYVSGGNVWVLENQPFKGW